MVLFFFFFFFFTAGPMIHHFHICWHYLAPSSSLVFYSDYRSSKLSFHSESFILISLFVPILQYSCISPNLFLAISLSWEFSLTLVWSFRNSLQISFTQCQIHCLNRKALHPIISRKYNQQSIFSNSISNLIVIYISFHLREQISHVLTKTNLTNNTLASPIS